MSHSKINKKPDLVPHLNGAKYEQMFNFRF